MAADWKVPESVPGSSGLLLNGLAAHGLGSFVDYDSPTFQANNSPTFRENSDVDASLASFVMVDELPFKMDDGVVESESESDSDSGAKELLLGAQLRHKMFYEDIVVKAFYEAEKAHRGQVC